MFEWLKRLFKRPSTKEPTLRVWIHIGLLQGVCNAWLCAEQGDEKVWAFYYVTDGWKGYGRDRNWEIKTGYNEVLKEYSDWLELGPEHVERFWNEHGIAVTEAVAQYDDRKAQGLPCLRI